MIKLESKKTTLPKLKAIQAELEATQAELEATQADLEATQTRLEALQTELESSQTNLEATEAELEASQAELEASQQQVFQLRERLQELKRQQAKEAANSTSLSPSSDKPSFSEWILLPMRVFLGLTFIYAGIQKLTDPQFFDPSMPGYIGTQIKGMAHGSPIHDFLISVALPHAVLFGWMTALGELAIGLGTYAGFLFRPAAFFGTILSITFFLSASWNTYPYFFGSDIVFAFCWITMILSGPLNTGLTSLDEWAVDQLIARSNAGQKIPLILQIYILLVVAGAPHKPSYSTGINLLKTNPIIRNSLQTYWHKPDKAQDGYMTRRVVIRDWAIGAIAVASITLLGIPLRIFGSDPNESLTEPSVSTTNSAPTASTPNTTVSSEETSTPETTSNPNAANTPKNSQNPIKTSTSAPVTQTLPPPGRQVSIGQTIAPAGALPANAAYQFVVASSTDSAVLIHLPDGKFVAFDATCTHSGCTVQYQPDSHSLICPCHNSKFDATSGTVLQPPATLPLSKLGIQLDSTGAIKLTSVPS